MLFPVAAGYALGLFTKIGVDLAIQTTVIVVEIGMTILSILVLFENRYTFLAASPKFWIRVRRSVIGLFYIIACTYFIPFNFMVPDQSVVGPAIIKRLEDLRCFYTGPIFVLAQDATLVAWSTFIKLLVEFTFIIVLVARTFTNIVKQNKTASLSKNTIALQKKFFVSITIQTAIPITVIILPLVYCAYSLSQATYCGCYAMSFTLFAVHFVYRYYATCKPDLLRFFNGFYFVAWVFGAIVVAASWGFAAFILYPETDRTKAALLHILNTSYNLDPDWVRNVPYSYWRTFDGVEYLNPRKVIGILQHGVIMTVSFGTVFFCGFETYKTINATRGVSDKTRELQNQLFKALVIQTIIPTFLMYLPTTMLFVTPFFGLNIGCYGNITTATLHLYPGLDPLVLLLLIRDFRQTIRRKIFFWSPTTSRVETLTNGKSIQSSASRVG
ncbi:hypothetical protein L3Y34_006720 [Caenorhabditis briggsae]|uniref:Uncharacterized protein n=1 Tax=Caenorhabditis briggsae TaxID=6238 RepID=A0AAE9CZW3_CAEBR|nr:hypothetical protein L3Y34_006720 [Caenorhabditis briggsae]